MLSVYVLGVNHLGGSELLLYKKQSEAEVLEESFYPFELIFSHPD